MKKNKKLSVTLTVSSLLIAVLMAVPMHFVISISSLFDVSAGLAKYLIKLGALMLLLVLYIVLHELTHGAAMKICGTKKVKYGFNIQYAYAGSDDYYDKKSYIFIALAPVILLGAILAVINFLVPQSWVWVIYFIQIMNISGAVGDFYVTFKFTKMPDDILVSDSGFAMQVYSKN